MTPLTAVLWRSRRKAEVFSVSETRVSAAGVFDFVSMTFLGVIRQRDDGTWLACEADDDLDVLAPKCIRPTAQEAIAELGVK